MRPCTIIGNVGADPELRFTPEGTSVCGFRIGHDAGKDKEGKSITTWLGVTCWGDEAERVNKQVHKGMKVCCEGNLQPANIYERKTGEMAAEQKMVAWEVKIVDYWAKPLEREAESVEDP